MEVIDQTPVPGEPVKAHPDAMQVDAPLPQPPIKNGHTIDSSPSALAEDSNLPTSQVNGHTPVDNSAPHPVTNGVSDLSLKSQSSDFTSSAPTFDSELLASSQSVPDVNANAIPDSTTPVTLSAPLEVTPVVLQPPTSDLREEIHVQDQELLAQAQERKQTQDLVTTPAVVDFTVQTPPASEPQLTEVAAVEDTVASLQPAIDNIVEQTQAPITTQPSGEMADAPASQPSAASGPGETTPASQPASAPATIPQSLPAQPTQPEAAQPEAAEPPIPVTDSAGDHTMTDAPLSPVKQSREREEDETTDEPSAKRAKTEDASADTADVKKPEDTTGETSEFKKPEVPTDATDAAAPPASDANGEGSAPPMTKAQAKHLLKSIGNLKRISSAKAFLAPVDWQTLNLPSYPSIITKPMDLGTLEANLRADYYKTVDAVVADFNLMVENSRTFNGPGHQVTQQALSLKNSFDKSMEKLPGPDVPGPASAERPKKATQPTHVKIPPARRESRSSLPGSARSPPASATAASPQTFALNPDGVPLIRRDSTVDGRPKREIHRPPPKDLPYNQKPKKKKFQYELKFCDKILTELEKPKSGAFNWPFLVPVDPVALNIPTYHSIIKKPMDLQTMRTKLNQGEYENAKDFEADARLIFSNCNKFNPPGDLINTAGQSMEKFFDGEWAKKREWLESNTPASGPASPGSSAEVEESEDEDDEDEDEDEEDEDQTELQKLQQHIAQLSKQVEMIQKKSKATPPAAGKKAKGKATKKEGKKSAAPALAKAQKSAPPKSKKERAPHVTYEQKQDISLRINSLSESKMAQALKIIRDNMPNLKGVQDDEIELDIDELSNEVLYKLLIFVRRHAPRPDDEPVPRQQAAPSSTAAPARKKNKPMSKHEQEARIAQVQNSLSAYNQGSPPAYPTSRPNATSGEDSASESSEEE